MISPFNPEPPAGARIVDARGELCPWPLLRAKAALGELEPGAQIAVYADDPLAGLDLRALCERAGHALLACVENSGQVYVLIAKV